MLDYTQNPKIEEGNVVSILITTDSHLGHEETHRILGKDSFQAFEETLTIGRREEVDMMLHAGDLFDKAHPSIGTMELTTKILRNYVYGEESSELEINNYEKSNITDKRLNVQLPIFIIHGNHDSPIGLGNERFSSLDVLHAAGLINHFGIVPDIHHILVDPIIITKANTKIALYGIGHIKDEWLNIAFEKGNIKFNQPKDGNAYFNILLFHQNKFKGYFENQSTRMAIKQELIPNFFNLVIWGHEHECIPSLQTFNDTRVSYLFAGSTVITSLIATETPRKHAYVIKIHELLINFQAFPLRNPRPLIYHQIELSQYPDLLKALDEEKNPKAQDEIFTGFLYDVIDHQLEEFKTENPNPTLQPLFKLKVERTGFRAIEMRKCQIHYETKIANWDKFFITFWKRGNLKALKNARKNAVEEECKMIDMKYELLGGIQNPSRYDLHKIMLKTSNIRSDRDKKRVFMSDKNFLRKFEVGMASEKTDTLSHYSNELMEECKKLAISAIDKGKVDEANLFAIHLDMIEQLVCKREKVKRIEESDEEVSGIVSNIFRDEGKNNRKRERNHRKKVKISYEESEDFDITDDQTHTMADTGKSVIRRNLKRKGDLIHNSNNTKRPKNSSVQQNLFSYAINHKHQEEEEEEKEQPIRKSNVSQFPREMKNKKPKSRREKDLFS